MNIVFTLLSVASIWSIAVITPGPNFFITAQTAVKHSRLAGTFIVLGTCTGTIIWAISGYYGVAYLFIVAPWIYTTLKVIGGGYIIYLGITVIIGLRKSGTKLDIPQENFQSNFLNWRKGLMTNLSNPKTAMPSVPMKVRHLPLEKLV